MLRIFIYNIVQNNGRVFGEVVFFLILSQVGKHYTVAHIICEAHYLMRVIMILFVSFYFFPFRLLTDIEHV